MGQLPTDLLKGRRTIRDDRTPVMLLPVHPEVTNRPPGDCTYIGPCVTVGDRLPWEALPQPRKSIGEMRYMGPCLRPEDLEGK